MRCLGRLAICNLVHHASISSAILHIHLVNAHPITVTDGLLCSMAHCQAYLTALCVLLGFGIPSFSFDRQAVRFFGGTGELDAANASHKIRAHRKSFAFLGFVNSAFHPETKQSLCYGLVFCLGYSSLCRFDTSNGSLALSPKPLTESPFRS